MLIGPFNNNRAILTQDPGVRPSPDPSSADLSIYPFPNPTLPPRHSRGENLDSRCPSTPKVFFVLLICHDDFQLKPLRSPKAVSHLAVQYLLIPILGSTSNSPGQLPLSALPINIRDGILHDPYESRNGTTSTQSRELAIMRPTTTRNVYS